MKKGIIAFVVVIVLAGGAYALTKNNNTKTTSPNSSSSSSSSQSQSQTKQTATATNNVEISSFKFSPADITVKKGTTVTWTNEDSTAHTVTETDGKDGPKSSSLNQGQSFTFTYNTVGTFKYNCSIHTDMTGSVTVTE